MQRLRRPGSRCRELRQRRSPRLQLIQNLLRQRQIRPMLPLRLKAHPLGCGCYPWWRSWADWAGGGSAKVMRPEQRIQRSHPLLAHRKYLHPLHLQLPHPRLLRRPLHPLAQKTVQRRIPPWPFGQTRWLPQIAPPSATVVRFLPLPRQSLQCLPLRSIPVRWEQAQAWGRPSLNPIRCRRPYQSLHQKPRWSRLQPQETYQKRYQKNLRAVRLIYPHQIQG
jgi:hypothetical protein